MNRKARTLRKRPTDAESALWRQLRLRQIEGCKFCRQHPIGPYIVDFVCLERKLIVEVDGGQHALQVQKDSERTAWLESGEYRVFRFWDHPPPQSSPSRGEEIHKGRGGIHKRCPFPP